MKIRVDGVATDGFRLELDGDKEPNFVELGPSSGLTGVYSQDEHALSLSNIAMSAAKVAQAEWHAGSLTILITAPATLGGAEIDAILPRGDDVKSGFIGSVGAKSLACDDVGLAAASFRLAAGVRAEKLRYWQDANAHKRASAKSLSLKKVRAKVGSLPLSAESLELSDVALKITKKGLDVSAASAEARGVVIHVGGTEITLEHLSLPQGLRYADGSVEVADVRASAVALALTFGGGSADGDDEPPKKDASDSRFDLPPLDALDGQIDVDVNVDATVPVLGVRKATHCFRIPVQNGAINFKEVERSLAALEDAVLDFEVEPGRLILEKDLPLIPFDNVTLVYWPLDGDDQALAERKRVRLRKLLEWRIPVELTKDKGDKKGSSVGLRRLGIENIDIDLSLGHAELPLGSSGKVTLGGEGRPGIEKLQVDGAIRYAPGEAPTPSALAIEATAISATSLELGVGDRQLRASTVAAGSIAGGKVSFEGFRPTGAAFTIKDVRIEHASLTKED